jgi:hypothetical protein
MWLELFTTGTRSAMLTDELIEKLKEAQERHGRALPAVLLTAGGSGEIGDVQIQFDTFTERHELWLVEKP